jgi:hypothetical protein
MYENNKITISDIRINMKTKQKFSSITRKMLLHFGTTSRHSPPAEGRKDAPAELWGQMTVEYVVEVPRAQYATPTLSHLCVKSGPNNHGPESIMNKWTNLTCMQQRKTNAIKCSNGTLDAH